MCSVTIWVPVTVCDSGARVSLCLSRVGGGVGTRGLSSGVLLGKAGEWNGGSGLEPRGPSSDFFRHLWFHGAVGLSSL